MEILIILDTWTSFSHYEYCSEIVKLLELLYKIIGLKRTAEV